MGRICAVLFYELLQKRFSWADSFTREIIRHRQDQVVIIGAKSGLYGCIRNFWQATIDICDVVEHNFFLIVDLMCRWATIQQFLIDIVVIDSSPGTIRFRMRVAPIHSFNCIQPSFNGFNLFSSWAIEIMLTLIGLADLHYFFDIVDNWHSVVWY